VSKNRGVQGVSGRAGSRTTPVSLPYIGIQQTLSTMPGLGENASPEMWLVTRIGITRGASPRASISVLHIMVESREFQLW
jgi:hypothetical protein